jgi:hypothetical protein
MPLKKGKSSKVVGSNIQMMMDEGKPRAQSVAIAMDKAGQKREFNSKNVKKNIRMIK